MPQYHYKKPRVPKNTEITKLAKIPLAFWFLMPKYHYALTGTNSHTKRLVCPYLFVPHIQNLSFTWQQISSSFRQQFSSSFQQQLSNSFRQQFNSKATVFDSNSAAIFDNISATLQVAYQNNMINPGSKVHQKYDTKSSTSKNISHNTYHKQAD